MEYAREHKLFVSSEGSEVEQELFDMGAAIEASAVDPKAARYRHARIPIPLVGRRVRQAMSLSRP